MPLYGPETSVFPSSSGELSASYVVATLTSSLPNARQLTAGTGINIVDHGAGAGITISAVTTGSFITPTALGQVLFAVTPAAFVPALILVTSGGYVMTNAAGYIMTSASL